MYDPTDFHDELNRKTIGALSYLANQLSSGEISEYAFKTGIISIWNCVSGLVSDDVEAIIDDVLNKQAGVTGDEKTEIFLDRTNNLFYVVRGWSAGLTVHIDKMANGARSSTIKSFETAKEANDFFKKAVEVFQQKYERI